MMYDKRSMNASLNYLRFHGYKVDTLSSYGKRGKVTYYWLVTTGQAEYKLKKLTFVHNLLEVKRLIAEVEKAQGTTEEPVKPTMRYTFENVKAYVAEFGYTLYKGSKYYQLTWEDPTVNYHNAHGKLVILTNLREIVNYVKEGRLAEGFNPSCKLVNNTPKLVDKTHGFYI